MQSLSLRVTLTSGLAAVAAATVALRPSTPTPAGPEVATLAELLDAADAWTVGVVRGTSVRSIDPGDGVPLYLTTLTVDGETWTLPPGATDTEGGTAVAPSPGTTGPVELLFPGGFVDDEHGSFNSIAPARHETRVGRHVVVFHRREDNAYASGPGRVLVGGRAGLFTAFESRDGRMIVQGRTGSGSLPHNLTLADLRRRVSERR